MTIQTTTNTLNAIFNANNPADTDTDYDDYLDVLLEPKMEEPPKYAVIVLNDDYTPMDFVVDVLMEEFHHSESAAMQIMLNIHHQGKGVAGIYSREIAETKATNVNEMAQQEGHPLATTIEPITG